MGMLTDFFYCDSSEVPARFPGWVVAGPDFMPDDDDDGSLDDDAGDQLDGLEVFLMRNVDEVVFASLARALGVTAAVVGDARVAPSGERCVQQVSSEMVSALQRLDATVVVAFVQLQRADIADIGNEAARTGILAACTVDSWGPSLLQLAEFARRAFERLEQQCPIKLGVAQREVEVEQVAPLLALVESSQLGSEELRQRVRRNVGCAREPGVLHLERTRDDAVDREVLARIDLELDPRVHHGRDGGVEPVVQGEATLAGLPPPR